MLLEKLSITVRRFNVDDDLKLWLPPADLTGGDKIRSFGVPRYVVYLGAWALEHPTSCIPYPDHLVCRHVGGKGLRMSACILVMRQSGLPLTSAPSIQSQAQVWHGG